MLIFYRLGKNRGIGGGTPPPTCTSEGWNKMHLSLCDQMKKFVLLMPKRIRPEINMTAFWNSQQTSEIKWAHACCFSGGQTFLSISNKLAPPFWQTVVLTILLLIALIWDLPKHTLKHILHVERYLWVKIVVRICVIKQHCSDIKHPHWSSEASY